MSFRFRPTLITAPVGRPVTAGECKAHAVVEHEEDDSLVEGLIDTAVSHFDGFRGILGRAILTQTWRVEMSGWLGCFELPVPDVSSVTITYLDEDGQEQDGPEVRLVAISAGTRVVLPSSWGAPALEPENPGPVRAEFVCGFGAAEEVPSAVKGAIMQMVAHLYAEREGISIAEPVYDRLIAPFRWSIL